MIRTLPPSAHPTFVAAFAATIQGSAGQVCATCGLGRMGHTPESRWLGHAEHPWTPVPATASDLERANRLTSEAYRRHNRRSWS